MTDRGKDQILNILLRIEALNRIGRRISVDAIPVFSHLCRIFAIGNKINHTHILYIETETNNYEAV